VACTVTGTLARDPATDAIRWQYRKEWRVPEGLEPALNEGVALASNRHTTFTRLVD
jgi:hypothetical protein